jgi:hypothetical protein
MNQLTLAGLPLRRECRQARPMGDFCEAGAAASLAMVLPVNAPALVVIDHERHLKAVGFDV